MEKDKENKILNVPALRFPEFSGEWKEVPFASNLERLENGVNYNTNDKDGVPMSRIETISTGRIDYTKVGYCSTPQKIEHYIMRYGDILFSHINSLKHIGKTAYYNAEKPLYHGMNLLLFRCKNNIDSKFFFFLINNTHFIRKCQILAKQAVNQASISTSDLKKIKVYIPDINEQSKIQKFLSLIEKRIEVQNKIIEKLETLIKGIVELAFSHAATSNTLGCYITQISQRNKTGKDLPVLSVSNKHGFVEQSEQFEDRIIASDDTSNYKIVDINDFAYNPARINVGSIARLKDKECGIVSPMYICFRTSKDILPEYLELFFKTVTFSFEVGKRLEGSVRLCLSYESLCEIVIPIISIREQQSLVKMATTFHSKLDVEKGFLSSYQSQKQCLLSQMFI